MERKAVSLKMYRDDVMEHCKFCNFQRPVLDFTELEHSMQAWREGDVRFEPVFPHCCADFLRSAQSEYLSTITLFLPNTIAFVEGDSDEDD